MWDFTTIYSIEKKTVLTFCIKETFAGWLGSDNIISPINHVQASVRDKTHSWHIHKSCSATFHTHHTCTCTCTVDKIPTIIDNPLDNIMYMCACLPMCVCVCVCSRWVGRHPLSLQGIDHINQWNHDHQGVPEVTAQSGKWSSDQLYYYQTL